MAQLSSPGVAVSVNDESFYTPAAAGTVPLIIIASQENKQNSAGTGIAPGTLKANAGAVYLLTSQMDLGATFGVPYFQTDDSNNPIHAGEVNEYGLQAAYSFLGVSNRAYVVRADLDTKQLESTAIAPTSAPANGTVWFDTVSTKFGVFEWNSNSATTLYGQTFTNKAPTVIIDAAQLDNGAPLSSIGALGDYAIVAQSNVSTLWLKKFQTSTPAGTWVQVGTPDWVAAWPAAVGGSPSSFEDATFTINGVSFNGNSVVDVTGLAAAINQSSNPDISGISAEVINGNLNLYTSGTYNIELTGDWAAAGITNRTYYAPSLVLAPHFNIPAFKTHDANPRPTGSLWIKTTAVNVGAQWVVKKYSTTTSKWVEQAAALYPTNAAALSALDPKGAGINLALGSLYVKYNIEEDAGKLATFEILKRKAVGATKLTSVTVTSSTFGGGANHSIEMAETVAGSSVLNSKTVNFAVSKSSNDAQSFVTAVNSAGFNNIVASLTNGVITLQHTKGGDIQVTDTTGGFEPLFPVASTTNLYSAPTGAGYDVVATLWTVATDAITDDVAPTAKPADGTLWYNGNIIDEVDIMINDGNGHWLGYANYDQPGGDITDPNGPLVTATKPTTQSDGVTPLATGDLWIDTSDLENYPLIYKFNSETKKWSLVDNADQTTENGVVFHDARWNTTGEGPDPASIVDLLSSNFLDTDAPDPALYPKGMLLWNLRRSGFNVKKYVVDYIDTTQKNIMMDEPQTDYYPDRWVSEAANNIDGSGAFGRKAQRAVVLQALNATIQSNQQIRQPDIRVFNLLSCPGYTETLKSLVGLNTDNGQTAFIVADTPSRLSPDATSLNNWGKNANNAAVDGDDGLITTDSYAAVYYPWGYTTDLTGANIVVPPSHMMLRTIALNDQVAYPWFAPAGVRRGSITNASSVGYVNPLTGEFNTVALNTGQRDTLADVHVNPITYLQGTGLVCYGQKTRQLVASSLDRINVARLVIYLRRQLDLLAKPFVFEPNDTITRNEIKQQVEKLLLELVGQRALYDYLVVCDTSNNTPARVDRNELHVDIAIEPVKAVEFIYIPLRLENTGAIKGLGA